MAFSLYTYSSDISTGDAIQQVYELSTIDIVKETALFLRGLIMKAFEDRNEFTWPPNYSDLKVTNDVTPAALNQFLSYLLDGKRDPATEKKICLSCPFLLRNNLGFS